MKKIIVALMLVISMVLVCGCESDATTFEMAEYSFDQATFTYDGKTFDMTAEAPGANAVTSVSEVGTKLVVECHVNPQNSIYGIFDAEGVTFETFIGGVNLIWHSDDITTAVYSFRGDVMTYDGNVIGSYALGDGEFIYSLAFSDDNTEVNVTISGEDEDKTEVIELK